MSRRMQGPCQTLSPSAPRLLDAAEAVRLLDAACQRQSSGSADALAPLVQSAPHLAECCTPALLSSVLAACDATTAVEAAPKKLTMLNAAWKLLLTIASHEAVEPARYGAAIAHMVEQLRWGVLAHDWSDKRRVRLATFFASHVVSTVRAHPRLLLGRAADATAVVGQLVRLYFAICATVATSTRDAEAVSLLYDNIVVRLQAVFDCLGAAAASTADGGDAQQHARADEEEEESGGAAAAGLSPRGGATTAAVPRRLCAPGKAGAVQDLLTQCLSTAAAQEVEEAAGGGVAVRMATAVAALSLHLHVVRGALAAALPSSPPLFTTGPGAADTSRGADDSRADGEAAHATASPGSRTQEMNEVVAESLIWWTQCTPAPEAPAASVRDASLREEVLTWAAALPPDVFCEAAAVDAAAAAAASSSSSPSLRALWTDTLATVWLRWLCGAADAHAQPSPGEIGAAGTRFASLLLSAVAGTRQSSPAALMAMEAWGEVLRRVNASVAASRAAPPHALPAEAATPTAMRHAGVVHVLLEALASLRSGATMLVDGLVRLQRLCLRRGDGAEDGTAAPAAPLQQWVCAAVAVLAYGEAVLGVPPTEPPSTAPHDTSTVAASVVSHLLAVMHVHLAAAECGAGGQAEASLTGYRGSTVPVAAAQLRHALLSVQHAQQRGLGGAATTVSPLTERAGTTLLLLRVPGAWAALAAATAHSASSSTAARDADAAERGGAELKAALLPLASLLASLTHTLQALGGEPTQSDGAGDETDVLPSRRPHACVARWVATRLLDGIAAVPLSEDPDDAVLVACVRRWTDLIFSDDATAAVRAADSVARADAAVALLRVMEECTSLPLEKLRLSEQATHSLMELMQGTEGGGPSDAVDQEGAGSDSPGSPSWSALWHREAVQWREAERWLATLRRCDDEVDQPGSERRVSPPPSLVEELRHGLRYCETVLQRLQTCALASDGVYARSHGKRRRAEDDEATQSVEATSLVQRVRRIQELSSAFLRRVGGGDGEHACETAEVVCDVTSGPLPSRSVGSATSAAVAKESSAMDDDVLVFTLTDTESLGGRHASSHAEVVDVE